MRGGARLHSSHVRTTTGDVADYTLRSFPLYMAELAFRSSPQ